MESFFVLDSIEKAIKDKNYKLAEELIKYRDAMHQYILDQQYDLAKYGPKFSFSDTNRMSPYIRNMYYERLVDDSQKESEQIKSMMDQS